MTVNIKSTYILLISFLVLGLLAATLFINTPRVEAAATPGCYVELPNGEANRSDCRDTDDDEVVANGRCVLYGANGTKAEKDCNDVRAANPGSGSEDGVSNLEAVEFNTTEGKHQCGASQPFEQEFEGQEVSTSINIGCKGFEIEEDGGEINPVVDMAFALFRVISAGVGIVVIGTIIVAGIQYSVSRGNPQAIEAAIKRVTNAVIALIVYIFMFAIANFLVPGGLIL